MAQGIPMPARRCSASAIRYSGRLTPSLAMAANVWHWARSRPRGRPLIMHDQFVSARRDESGHRNHLRKRPTMRLQQAVAVALAFFGFIASARAAEKLGIVMLHGKQGVPEQLEAYDGPLGALGHF